MRVGIPVLCVIAVLAGLIYRDVQKWRRYRTQWKTVALSRLASMTLTNQEVISDFVTFSSEEGGLKAGRWTGHHALMMKNGEYLLYEFRHGANARYLSSLGPHLFLARGSNGRWYYSTYHFCMNMAAVIGEAPPDSVSDFSKKYFAREFDGKSDECLNRTWP